jgi:hypothetical protein
MKHIVAFLLAFMLTFAPAFAVGTDVQSSQPVQIPDITQSGTISVLTGHDPIVLNGQAVATMQITGTWVGTITFEGSTDGTNFFSVPVVPTTGGASVTTTTTNGNWTASVGGLVRFRATMSSYTSGTATVAIRAGQGSNAVVCIAGCSSTGGGTTTTYNSSPPTLTSGGTSALQSDVNGNLKVNVITGGGGSSGTTTAPTTAPTNAPGTTSVPQYSNPNGDLRVALGSQGATSANPIYGTDPNVRAINQDSSNNQGTFTAGSQDIVTSGSLTSATSLTTTPYGNGTFAVEISGTWAGTITWEGSVDGTNYVALVGSPDGTTSPAGVLTTTANGQWRGNVAGMNSFRVRMSTYTSGTAVITIRLSNSGGGSGSSGGGGGGGSSAGTTTTVPTSAPTNAPGTTGVPNYSNPNGDLRVAFGSQGATTTSPIYGTDPNVRPINQDSNNNQLTVAAGNADTVVSGSLASATSLTAVPYGNATFLVSITGTWAGTITWEGSVDGTNYTALNAQTVGALSPINSLTTTANTIVQGNMSGMASFRVRMSTYTSGTAVVTIRLSNAPLGQTVNNDAYSSGVEYHGIAATTTAQTLTFTNPYSQLLITGYGYATTTAVAYCAFGTTAVNGVSGGLAIPNGAVITVPWKVAGASTTVSCIMSTSTGNVTITALR